MKVIYGRISTANQNMERQLEKDGKCFIDICSGTIPFMQRKESNEALYYLEKNNLRDLYVEDFDRLGRNALDILNTINDLSNRGINIHIKSLGMSILDDQGKRNVCTDMVVHLLALLSDMQRKLQRESAMAGIEIAQKKGVYKGKPMGANMKDETIRRRYAKGIVIYQSMLNGGDSLLKIERVTKDQDISINRATLKKLIGKGLLIKPEKKKTKQLIEKVNLRK